MKMKVKVNKMTQKYRKVWESNYLPFLYAQWNLESNLKELKKNLGVGYRNSIIVGRNSACETFYSEQDMERESKIGLSIFSDNDKAKKLLGKSRNLAINGLKFNTELFNSDLSEKNNKELLKKFLKNYDLTIKLFGVYHTTQPQCFKLVKEELSKYLETKKINPLILLDLTVPTSPSIIKKSEIDWHKIVLDDDKGGIIDYHDKYRFLGTEEGMPHKPLSHFIKKFDNDIKIGKHKIKDKIEKIMDSLESIKSKQDFIIKKYKISPEIQELSRLVQDFSHARLEIRLAWVSGEWGCRKIFEEIGKRFQLSVSDLENYSKEEIIKLLEKEEKVDQQIVNERKELFVAFLKDSKYDFLTGNEAERYFKLNNLDEKIDLSEVHGQTANKGYAKGKATVIRAGFSLNDEMKKMQKGDILIVTQTKPLFMPIIMKASAVVTDEGGITGHAAVVSRELNIPCVIAAHNATKMFKDGDLVEVQADKGIVKKII
ncbi:MAG: PEP-utilizing enzyme [Candidatus Woesearchaeota archaeon]